MEIVIKIPKNVYKALAHTEFDANLVVNEMRKSIANGIPLPKCHGRMIDADALIDTLGCSDRDGYTRACIEEDAPTIIEADKESEDE